MNFKISTISTSLESSIHDILIPVSPRETQHLMFEQRTRPGYFNKFLIILKILLITLILLQFFVLLSSLIQFLAWHEAYPFICGLIKKVFYQCGIKYIWTFRFKSFKSQCKLRSTKGSVCYQMKSEPTELRCFPKLSFVLLICWIRNGPFENYPGLNCYL